VSYGKIDGFFFFLPRFLDLGLHTSTYLIAQLRTFGSGRNIDTEAARRRGSIASSQSRRGDFLMKTRSRGGGELARARHRRVPPPPVSRRERVARSCNGGVNGRVEGRGRARRGRLRLMTAWPLSSGHLCARPLSFSRLVSLSLIPYRKHGGFPYI